jgi:predicted CoA-binding protein
MPRPTIAIIGASRERSKFGNKAVRAYASRNYQVYPVHPTAETVEGLPAYRSILDVPADSLDRISVYLPSQVGLKVLDEIARKPAREIWLNPGADDATVVARARALGLNVILGCSIVDVGVNPHALPG